MKKLWSFVQWTLFEIISVFLFLALRTLTVLYEIVFGRKAGLIGAGSGQGKAPVLLVHGLGMDHFIMAILDRRLRRAGWGPIYRMNLGPRSWTIEKHADLFMQVLQDLHAKHGQINVIAHSMGGLVSRYAIQFLGAAPYVAKLVTLVTPHFGTPMARLAWSVSGRQMRPKSAFIQRLNDLTEPFPRSVACLFIFSNLDILVPGRWGGHAHPINLAGWHFVPYHGHMSILLTGRVFSLINNHLAGETSQTPTDQVSESHGNS